MNNLPVEEPKKSTLDGLTFSQFDEGLENLNKKLKQVENVDQIKQVIFKDFSELCNLFISTADKVHIKQLESYPKLDIVEAYLINYSFPEYFKNVVILHRDVFLELNKSEIYLSEKSVNKNQIEDHFSKSKLILEEKIKDFENKMQTNRNSVKNNKKEQQKVLKKLTLHDNPWDVYKNQINTLLLQFNEIKRAHSNLNNTVSVCKVLKNVVESLKENFNDLTSKLQTSATHILSDFDDKVKHKNLTFFIEEQLVKTVALGNNQVTFTEELNVNISKLEKIKAPIAIQNGMLTVRESDFGKTIQKWFDYQILPDFMDVIAIENSLKNLNSICLNNLKNSIQLEKINHNDENLNIYKQVINNLKNDIAELGVKGEQTIEKIINNCNEQLLVSNFIKGQPFLEVPFNSSLHLNSDNFLISIKQSIQKGFSFFNSQFKKSASFNTEPNVELATQCLTYRMFKDINEHYDSLFLNKKFIGDLFLISRETQEEKLSTAISQWNNGFNKSVLVTGERLSGRTTFIDYTSKKYFGKDIVNLNPNSVATIDGRKFTTTNNLKEALQYIKNNNIKSTKPLILIDDLELWRDNENNLLSNVRALINFIETESDDAFVMVATSNSISQHLDTRLAFSTTFSTVVDVSKTDKNKIKEALLLRHGAAHRKLVTEDSEPLTTKQIEKAINKLSNKYHNNLGDVLQAWTYNTFVKEDDTVLFKNEEHEFPNFFSHQELIILKQASVFKTITEFGLKRVMASGFEEDFKSATKRLINTKVLLRDKIGNLYINPVVLNEVNVFINQRN